MKLFYLVYKLTNLVNGKIYVGCHITKNVDDNYMGSGRRLGYAKKKYGVENFKKEILSVHETPEEMFTEEARIVDEEFIKRDDVYNLVCGGFGWIVINKHKAIIQERNVKCSQKFVERFKSDPELKAKFVSLITERNKTNPNIHAALIHRNKTNNPMIGKKHSDITRTKLSRASSGKGNSQFGTVWINLDGVCKKVKLEQLNQYPGWTRGRS